MGEWVRALSSPEWLVNFGRQMGRRFLSLSWGPTSSHIAHRTIAEQTVVESLSVVPFTDCQTRRRCVAMQCERGVLGAGGEVTGRCAPTPGQSGQCAGG